MNALPKMAKENKGMMDQEQHPGVILFYGIKYVKSAQRNPHKFRQNGKTNGKIQIDLYNSVLTC